MVDQTGKLFVVGMHVSNPVPTVRFPWHHKADTLRQQVALTIRKRATQPVMQGVIGMMKPDIDMQPIQWDGGENGNRFKIVYLQLNGQLQIGEDWHFPQL